MSKIIVLRGNSESCKSSVARKIQESVTPHPMLIEHDHFRRKVLRESEGPNIINDELIFRTIQFALDYDKDVIIEGIMRIDTYKKLFDRIIATHPKDNYFYYFDIPFEETLKRHATKLNTDFGKDKMQ